MEGRWFIQCTLPIKLRQPPCDCKIAEVTFNSIIILKYIQEKKQKKPLYFVTGKNGNKQVPIVCKINRNRTFDL
jgi:hypothetical protein